MHDEEDKSNSPNCAASAEYICFIDHVDLILNHYNANTPHLPVSIALIEQLTGHELGVLLFK